MKPSRADALAASLVLIASLVDSVIFESYHRMWAEAKSLAGFTALLVLIVPAMLFFGERWRYPPRAQTVRRVLFTAALSLIAYRLVGSSLEPVLGGGASKALLAAAAVLAMVGVARLPEAKWSRLRAASVVGTVLFVVSPVLIGSWRAPDLVWPPGFDAAAVERDKGHTVTMAVLLDELGARNAQPIVEALKRAGLQVNMRAVPSVGPNTSEVVPSMFRGVVFRSVRPCSPSAICSASTALDFARIHASRADIDVVGFFHPYCDIQGLRSCFNAHPAPPWLDDDRWRCALWRQFALPLGVGKARCGEVYAHAWSSIVQETVDATLRAPALSRGGVLFTHVPLPHPPGPVTGGNLQADYTANIGRAVTLLEKMIATARRSGLRVRAVVFSDHPLRQQQWCTDFAPYAWNGCRPSPEFVDDHVPMITAGDDAADPVPLATNQDVFKLMAAWHAQDTALMPASPR